MSMVPGGDISPPYDLFYLSDIGALPFPYGDTASNVRFHVWEAWETGKAHWPLGDSGLCAYSAEIR